MRLVSWNCGWGFHRKISALSALAPDVAIVQECADLGTLARKAPEFTPTDALWTGNNPHRGLGVFSFGPYPVASIIYLASIFIIVNRPEGLGSRGTRVARPADLCSRATAGCPLACPLRALPTARVLV
jgi:hypothetical protein